MDRQSAFFPFEGGRDLFDDVHRCDETETAEHDECRHGEVHYDILPVVRQTAAEEAETGITEGRYGMEDGKPGCTLWRKIAEKPQKEDQRTNSFNRQGE